MLYHYHDCNYEIQSSDQRTGTRKAAHTTWYIFNLYETYFDYFFMTFYFHLVNIAILPLLSKYSCERKRLFYQNSTMHLQNSKWCACTHAWETKKEVGEDMNSYQLYCLSNAIHEMREKNSYHIYCFLVGILKNLTTVIPLIWNSTLSSELSLYCFIITRVYISWEERLMFLLSKPVLTLAVMTTPMGCFTLKKPFFLCKWRQCS